jgi:hypothetical protein
MTVKEATLLIDSSICWRNIMEHSQYAKKAETKAA